MKKSLKVDVYLDRNPYPILDRHKHEVTAVAASVAGQYMHDHGLNAHQSKGRCGIFGAVEGDAAYYGLLGAVLQGRPYICIWISLSKDRIVQVMLDTIDAKPGSEQTLIDDFAKGEALGEYFADIGDGFIDLDANLDGGEGVPNA